MRISSRLALLALPVAAALLSSCGTMTTSSRAPYHVTALKPHNPDKVSVKLSLSTQNVYVMEGDRLLMAVQGNVGKNNTTPRGNFHITDKIKNKRRVSEPDAGYPMAYWCEFLPAYGFHEGFVHPVPHTHGCIRLHREAAARLFALVKVGTPVSIATTQPEDKEYASRVMRLDQSKDPDPPRSFMHSPAWFHDPQGPLLTDG